MCIVLAPAVLAAATLATGVASAGAGLYSQIEQGNAQVDANKAAIKNINQSTADSYAFTQLKWTQERSAAAQEKFNADLEARQARSTAIVAAGEGGVLGNSVNGFLADYFARQGRYNDSVDQNYQMSRDYLFASMDQTRNQAQSQINSLPAPQRPGYLDAAIRVAASGLQAATVYNRVTEP